MAETGFNDAFPGLDGRKVDMAAYNVGPDYKGQAWEVGCSNNLGFFAPGFQFWRGKKKWRLHALKNHVCIYVQYQPRVSDIINKKLD